jgi:hypothetical protein
MPGYLHLNPHYPNCTAVWFFCDAEDYQRLCGGRTIRFSSNRQRIQVQTVSRSGRKSRTDLALLVLGQRASKYLVVYKDGDRRNCCRANLELVSRTPGPRLGGAQVVPQPVPGDQ